MESVIKRAKAFSAQGQMESTTGYIKVCLVYLGSCGGSCEEFGRNRVIPRVCRRAEGIFIPKEQESTELSLFRPICLVNVEGKIFFSIVAQRQVI